MQLRTREYDLDQRNRNCEAEMNRTIATQQNEFKIKEANLKDEFERLKINLEEKHEIEIDKVTALTKLESEQKIAKAQLNADRRVAEVENDKVKAIAVLETAHAEAISKVKQDEAQQHYGRMSDAMVKMNTEGSVLTKNMHELSMKLLDRAHQPNIQETRFLTGRIDGQPGNDPKTIVTDGQTVNTVVT